MLFEPSIFLTVKYWDVFFRPKHLFGSTCSHFQRLFTHRFWKRGKKDIVQLELFDEQINEVVLDDGKRYVLKRNPIRAEEIAASRKSKLQSLSDFVAKKNEYLSNHRKSLDLLSSLCGVRVTVQGIEIYQIPSPRAELRQLFKLSGVPVPMVLPKVRGDANAGGAGGNVDTERRLPSRRKSQ